MNSKVVLLTFLFTFSISNGIFSQNGKNEIGINCYSFVNTQSDFALNRIPPYKFCLGYNISKKYMTLEGHILPGIIYKRSIGKLYLRSGFSFYSGNIIPLYKESGTGHFYNSQFNLGVEKRFSLGKKILFNMGADVSVYHHVLKGEVAAHWVEAGCFTPEYYINEWKYNISYQTASLSIFTGVYLKLTNRFSILFEPALAVMYSPYDREVSFSGNSSENMLPAKNKSFWLSCNYINYLGVNYSF